VLPFSSVSLHWIWISELKVISTSEAINNKRNAQHSFSYFDYQRRFATHCDWASELRSTWWQHSSSLLFVVMPPPTENNILYQWWFIIYLESLIIKWFWCCRSSTGFKHSQAYCVPSTRWFQFLKVQQSNDNFHVLVCRHNVNSMFKFVMNMAVKWLVRLLHILYVPLPKIRLETGHADWSV